MRPKNKFSIIFIFVIAFVLTGNARVVLAVRVPGYSTDVNAPQPTVKPPANPPWDWVGNSMPVTLGPNDHIWIGAYNKYDPNRTKSVSIFIGGSPGKLEAESAVGYEPNGTTVSASPTVNGYFDSSDYTWFFSFYFPIQPDWEAFKIKNKGPGNQTIGDISVSYTCYGSSSVENRSELDNCSIGHSDHQGQITQLLFAHESAFLNTMAEPTLTVSEPGEIWTPEYVIADPNTGELLPQGAWLWTCIAGDGIAAEEQFDLSLTTEDCLPPGDCLLRVYDSNSTEWMKFQLPMAEPQANPADLDENCIVDFNDFAHFVDNWLTQY